ncbi:hypothetical protein ACJZ2D_007953 [Fusarium nematophilum]
MELRSQLEQQGAAVEGVIPDSRDRQHRGRQLRPRNPLAGNKANAESGAPWQGWTPDPARPEDKPWIEWMNDSRFQGKDLIKQAAADLKQRERGRERTRATAGRGRAPTLSPQGTVAEGG